MLSIQEHFDTIAPDYDSYKRRNWYYYRSLKRLIERMVEPGKRILEIGCGTGEILASIDLKLGVGIDTSRRMVQLAKRKYLNRFQLSFVAGSLESVSETESSFDYILLVDVVEHLDSVPSMVRQLRKVSRTHTQVIISMANPSWEFLLVVVERLGLKMPEGPHYRISAEELTSEFIKNGFQLRVKKKYLHLPVYIPMVSEPINKLLAALPLVRNLGLIELMVFQVALS